MTTNTSTKLQTSCVLLLDCIYSLKEFMAGGSGINTDVAIEKSSKSRSIFNFLSYQNVKFFIHIINFKLSIVFFPFKALLQSKHGEN